MRVRVGAGLGQGQGRAGNMASSSVALTDPPYRVHRMGHRITAEPAPEPT